MLTPPSPLPSSALCSIKPPKIQCTPGAESMSPGKRRERAWEVAPSQNSAPNTFLSPRARELAAPSATALMMTLTARVATLRVSLLGVYA